VWQINYDAFARRDEADLVDRLRAAATPYLGLVAEAAGGVIGHIAFSPVTLEPPHPNRRVLGLAPMAVRPNWQRRGVGSALVRAGLAACSAAGVDAVVVLGHPDYYPRFGFEPASRVGLRCVYEVPDEALMALALTPGALPEAGGVVHYHPAFGG
jgi:putative acetyltransferase